MQKKYAIESESADFLAGLPSLKLFVVVGNDIYFYCFRVITVVNYYQQ